MIRLISLMLLVAGRLSGESGLPSPTQSLEVPVAKITGFSGTLTRGMRVDALFFAAGAEDARVNGRQLVLALRNVEVISSVAVRDFGRGAISQRTTLRLTGEQVRTIQKLPPAAVEITVMKTSAGSRAHSRTTDGAAPRRAGRHARAKPESGQGVAPEASSPDQTWQYSSSSAGLWPTLWRSVIWGAVAGLVGACGMQMFRIPRRRLTQKKKNETRPWRHYPSD